MVVEIKSKVNVIKPKLLVVDPATNITGYAVFEEDSRVSMKGDSDLLTWKLIQFGLIKAGKIDTSDDKLDNMNMRCLSINSRLREWIILNLPSECVLEFPEHQPGRGIGASKGAHAIRLLAFLVGKISLGWELYMAEIIKRTEGRVGLPFPTLIEPHTWKGQLPKHVVNKRCAEKFKVDIVAPNHDNYVDAIMIGEYHIKTNGHNVNYSEIGERIDL